MTGKNSRKTAITAYCSIILFVILLASNTVAIGELKLLNSEIQKLNLDIQEMRNSSMETSRITDLVAEAKLYIDRNDYNKTESIISEAKNLVSTAFLTKQKIESADNMITGIARENSLEESENNMIIINKSAEWDLSNAKKEFQKENYDEATKMAEESEKSLIKSIKARYQPLISNSEEIERRLDELNLSKSRISFLKATIQDNLKSGGVAELVNLEKELSLLSQSIASYKEVLDEEPILEKSKLSSNRLKDDLMLAQVDISTGSYETAIRRLNTTKLLVREALGIMQEIQTQSIQLNEEETKPEADKKETMIIRGLLEKANSELIIGNYDGSRTLVNNAMGKIEELKAGISIKKAREDNMESLQNSLKKSLPYIIPAAIIIALVFAISRKTISGSLRKRRVKKLHKELLVCEESIKTLQKEFFIRKKMSRESYYEAYDTLQKRILKLKDSIESQSKRIKNLKV